MSQTPERKPPRMPDPVIIVHPFLLAVVPALGLYANNLSATAFGAFVRPALVMAGTTFVLWLVLALLMRRIHKPAILLSLLTVACFSGWTVLEYVIELLLPLVGLPPTWLYFTVFAAGAVGCLVWVIWRLRERPGVALSWSAVLAGACVFVPALAEGFLFGTFNRAESWIMALYVVGMLALAVVIFAHPGPFKQVSRTLNWFAAVLVLLYLAQIAVNKPQYLQLETPPLTAQTATGSADLPDLYVVMLDGFPRQDILRMDLGAAGTKLTHRLETLGFTVLDGALANYSEPSLSLAACLNLDYVQELLPDAIPPEGPLWALYRKNRLLDFARANGYRVTVFDTGLQAVQPQDNVDRVLEPAWTMTDFEVVLLTRTLAGRALTLRYAARYGYPTYWQQEPRRARVEYVFDTLPAEAARPSDRPRLFYAHLPVPTPPFLFNERGGRSKPVIQVTEEERRAQAMVDFRTHYENQVDYVAERLAGMFGAIDGGASRPASILLLSTSGYGAVPETERDAAVDGPGRFAVLAAVRLPETAGDPDGPRIPRDATLVNVMRHTLNAALGTNLPLLRNDTYIAGPGFTFDRVDVRRAEAAG